MISQYITRRTPRFGFGLCGLLLGWLMFAAAPVRALDQDAAVRLCREWLTSQNPAERQRLMSRLAWYDGQIEPVLRALTPRVIGP